MPGTVTLGLIPTGLPNGTLLAVHKLGTAGGDGIIGADVLGNATSAIAAGATSPTVIKATAAILARVLVTALGTAAMSFYDNASAASGTVIGVVPANSQVGSVFTFLMPCVNGIVASGNAANPGVTVSWA